MSTEKKQVITDFYACYTQDAFRGKTRKKQKIIFSLLVLSLFFFFSIPFLNNCFPNVMAYKIGGAFNVGLLWAILQYPIGGMIAWCYASKMKYFDNQLDPQSLSGAKK
ncbi:DUF485 domain-containing protein [Klebsiella sp. NPDC088457]